MGGGGGRGAVLFMVLVKRCEEAEGSFSLQKIFATGGEFSLL